MKATIKDVAKAAGMSITAVSQVLNNRPCRISQEKREKILAAAKLLNYTPNKNAVALVTNRTNVIGVILNDISNVYFAEFAKGAEDEAYEHGYQILMVNIMNKKARNRDFSKLLGFDSTDGLILTRDLDTPELTEYIHAYMYDRKKPVANAGNGEVMFPSGNIIFKSEQGSYMATAKLLELGHRKIGCITGPDYMPSSRLNGYKRALEEYGVPYDPHYVYAGDYHPETAAVYAKKMVEDGVTAIFTFNDLMAYGVYRMAEEQHLEIGKQLSVIGFDDIEFSTFFRIPLSSVRQPAYEMGRASCQMVIEMIKNGTQKSDDIYFEPELMIRASVDVPFNHKE